MPSIDVKHKFAWKPVRTKGGKWIWLKKYVQKAKFYWGDDGEPVLDVYIFTEREWLLETIRDPIKEKVKKMPAEKQAMYY